MMPSSLVWTISLPLLALALVVSVFLWRRITDTGLIVLSLVVCVMALVFVPLLRVLPERVGIPFFVVGLGPLLVILLMAIAVSTARFAQARTGTHLLSLALSILALTLFFVNATTAWIWPYASY
jgi:hypothetical protein